MGYPVSAKTVYFYKFLKQESASIFASSHSVHTPELLVNEILSHIPTLSNKKILVLFNVEFVVSLVYTYNIDPTNITFYSDHDDKSDFVKRAGNINIINNLGDLNMKFDVVVGNPPYNGLDIKFFNKGVSLLNDSGTIFLVHTTSVFFNKKTNKKSDEDIELMENLKTYATDVKFFDPTKIFPGVQFGSYLAVTKLTKSKTNNKVISSVQFTDGRKFNNVRLEDISLPQVDPTLFSTIRSKYEQFVLKNGSMDSLLSTDVSKKKVPIPKIRGNAKDLCGLTYYTFSDNEEVNDNYLTDFGFLAKSNKEIGHINDYLKSYVARFGLAILKFNLNMHRGESKLVPLVDFSKTYTDDELFKMLGLTTSEVAEIKRVISNYYAR